ncbi:MAG: HlyD family type I secretion periplasmic adaptor subunit [Rickettsiales bacterium]|nr:HlyD family type I secretion periplasmic adaptor subunit [Rickettsiales bacterium]
MKTIKSENRFYLPAPQIRNKFFSLFCDLSDAFSFKRKSPNNSISIPHNSPETVLDSPKIAEKTINSGIKTLVIFTLIFLSWATFVPIKSASVADGIVVLDFSKKNIQHLEGGIVDEILVKEGQMVNAGDVLIYLHDIKTRTEQQTLKEKLWTMELQKERLKATKDNKPTLNLSKFFAENEDISKDDYEKLREIANNQIRLFKAMKDKKNGELKVLEKKLKSAEIRLAVLRKEFNLIKPLVDEDNLPILREFDLQKSIAMADEEAEVTRLQITNYKNGDLSETLTEIKESDMEISSLYNQLANAKDVLHRSAITSPTSGKVMNIKYHTVGAVVPPGGELMSIVPQNEELIIEAKLKPQDIDNVAVNMESKISLTAYKEKTVPKINGKVINVSPDIVTNDKSGESYFLARIAIDKDDIAKLKNKVELYPGMPAQVFIITGSRSLISYLFTPISDSTYKAFREE